MNWYPVELHTHTEHSDGDFTVTELVRCGKKRGFHAIALTDHNTMSGFAEYERALEEFNMVGIPGIEWTTYWGHMLVLREYGYTDWRGVRPEQIQQAIASIHENCGLVGIAHPFALSNPINTGYHWEFHVSDWNEVDFIEIWSRDDAPCKIQSYRAIELWEQLLSRGCHLTATSGRDWHREDTYSYAHTYIGTEEKLSTHSILDAIRHGRVCLAAGALLTMQANYEGQLIQIGQSIPAGTMQITLTLDDSVLPNDWNREKIYPNRIELVHNGQVIRVCPAVAHQTVTVEVGAGWLRADCIGTYHQKPEEKIAITNPIYLV